MMQSLTADSGMSHHRRRSLRNVAIVAALVVMMTALSTDPAYAQGTDGITSMADNILNWLTGAFAKTIATIAVVVVGFMFFTGRASLPLLVTVIVGIFIVFSAKWIVNTIVGGG